jgi:precorrin-6Y C5,15-methyltransferase (decarboxylating)
MAHPIDIIGIGADGPAGLRPDLVDRIHSADFLAGGERHLRYFPSFIAERFILRDNLSDLVSELQRRFATQRCVVLASGDPLFYGIGTSLAGMLGHQAVRIEPAISSMQLAFARAAVPWQDAALASIHGRDLRATLLPLLGRRRIGLFTLDGDSPAAVARFFLLHGLNDYEAVVGENLGSPEERVTRWANLRELATQRFASLNYVVLRRTHSPLSFAELERNRALVPGVPDDAFERPDNLPEMMTRQEVRSVLLAKLAGLTEPGDSVWDVGAGLGTVAIEIAVLRPHVEVVAVERDPLRANFLRRNRERFDAYNIRAIEGVAPAVLARETERPRLIFIGGSGDNFGPILELAAARLLNGGRILANFVTLENLALMLQRLREWRWQFEVTEVHVARSDSLANHTGLKPMRGVFIVRTDKAGGNP